MRFGEPLWLFGTALSLIVAASLLLSGFLARKAVRRFGDEDRVRELITDDAGGRRALKGVLSVLALACCFVALAKPQYGRGTRLVPATNLDVVIVLDYSKSMYARDVPPSRIERAKAEVARLIADLPGARFGAVAFSGEPVSFPLTSDGASIAQFFRQLAPNDMPVGGTAIARALEAGRQLLVRDALSKRHKRVLMLVTDGEDLEGDPVAAAKAVAQDGTAVHVVQIGGRTPEPIPEVDEAGAVIGFRSDGDGRPLTTSLSAEGEKVLTEVAAATGGTIVRSERGDTGISEVTRSLKRLMTEELSERVETVYADVYAYPASLAVLLLFAEAFIAEAARKRVRRTDKKPGDARSAALTSIVLAALGCESTHKDVFTRYSPEVDRAIAALDAGAADAANARLAEYLSTGRCKEGQIGTPDTLKTRPNASFDLGLALFEIGEHYGARFGEENSAATEAPGTDERRNAQVECALRIVKLVATVDDAPAALKARADYLAGNLEFLRGEYESAVQSYDAALKRVPGAPEGQGDPIGRDAAYNRAIALRRVEDEKKKDEPDGGPPDGGPPEDGGEERDGGKEEPADAGEKNEPADSGKPDEPESADGGEKQADPHEKQQDEQKPEDAPPQPTAQASAQPAAPTQDERMLDALEQAPTFQQEAAKRQMRRQRIIGMEDK